jgi:orotidine-5'-phosphate decarboxylase
MEAKERIILALDVSSHNEAIGIVNKFKEHIEIFKVGTELFTSAGPKVVEEIHSMGKKVFLDLKFHDIPNTVVRSALAVSRLGVFMFNVHTLGGLEMMQHTARTLSEYCLEKNMNRPKLIGVTILTSIDQDALRDELGISFRLNTQVRQLAVLAQRAGLDGVVASPEDAFMIRSHFGKGFLIVTPGIRPSWATNDDQKRTLTPREAINRGADYLVIGRSITSQPDPLGTLKRIEEELKGL